MYSWLKNLRIINEKGIVFGYGIHHESLAPLNGWTTTPDLIVSFDGVNMTLPGRTYVKLDSPWPHQDQNPEKTCFRCLQEIVNLLPNGPRDGGLIVCKGAHLTSEESHEEFKDEPDKIWAWTKERRGFAAKGTQWLKNKGFKWVKLCAEPGDLPLWDSPVPHCDVSPEGRPLPVRHLHLLHARGRDHVGGSVQEDGAVGQPAGRDALTQRHAGRGPAHPPDEPCVPYIQQTAEVKACFKQ
ncbi:hypothetical protein PpBr36_05073 [Pyricularia pennisetigena]|uniref:hypothetical protein n=1 Tax=Pyricularia pennisetigena TaxID=1578925 RepID=UPI0011535621|nr:hypothetical protein PpBr36_05073 [Pyricularia pennisetigena]TLS26945.1 hypothetical protein PpBr36_05073 [Pyricularia pennisetigena]